MKNAKATADDCSIERLSHIRKYDDAIKWAAGRSTFRLSTAYYTEMDTFINAYKKEYTGTVGKKYGDERDADPITCTLFRLICKWAIEDGNIFVWVFSLAMWNLVSRSCDIWIRLPFTISREINRIDKIQARLASLRLLKIIASTSTQSHCLLLYQQLLCGLV